MAADWIEWKGGERPVPNATRIDVKFVSGSELLGAQAGNVVWSQIKAYRLADQQTQPAGPEVWINWHSGKCPVPKNRLVDVKGPGDAVFRNVRAGDALWDQVVAFRLAAEQPAKCVAPSAAADPQPSKIGPGRIWFKTEATPGTDGPAPGVRQVTLGEVAAGPNPLYHLAVPGYESLAGVLRCAYAQAAAGKGAERHAQGEPFDQQVMQDMARRFGVGALLGQAFKKSEESQRLPRDRAVAELLGAINYLAGAVIALEKGAE